MTKILVIGENENDFVAVRRVLEKEGYRALYASSGQQGLELVPNSYLDQQIQGSKENSGLISTQSTYFCQELSFKSL